jgi:hypothetical protein
MPRKGVRRLVVDASVAGEPSKKCRAFLEAILEICHSIIMTQEIAEEWKNHAIRSARKWRVRMEARKKVQRIRNIENCELRDKIKIRATKEKEREAMLKDVILIEAALASDTIVISLDETVRSVFSKASRTIGELRNIVWVNPERPEEQPIPWLKNGARPEKSRTLGFLARES